MWDDILTPYVKGVLFDLDDTLYNYNPCHEQALYVWCETVAQDLNISVEQALEEYNQSRVLVNTQLRGSASSHSRLLYSQKVSEKYTLNMQQILAWEKSYWDTFMGQMQIFPSAISFLEKCKQQQIKICLVSDMTAEIQLKKLLRLDIAHYFNYVVTSEESGQEKPMAYSFLLALHKLNLKADDVIMIGDSKQKDIVGALLLGIKAYFPFFES